MSVNDTFILQSLIYKLLERVISSVSLFYSVQKVFEDIKFVTELGQMLDLNTINHKTHSINYQFVFLASLICLDTLPRIITSRSSRTRLPIIRFSFLSIWASFLQNRQKKL